MMENNTVVTTYGEACEVMQYADDFCGCCRSKFYNEWYDANEAYFVRKGIFVVDDLMYLDCLKDGKDDKKPVRYCFKFDFSENTHSSFTILNYYNQEKIADFRFIRSDNPEFKEVKVRIDYMDLKKFKNLGRFTNPIFNEKMDKSWKVFYSRTDSLPKAKLQEAYNKQVELDNKMTLQFMCEHTVEMVHACMYYYTKEKPQQIQYDSYFGFQEDLEYTTKKETYIYKYTGYINLNDTKVYRTKINRNLDDEKRKEYDRHIESWTVKGHYRTIKGKKVWIKDHIRGEGALEQRIYGTKPESEVLLIPKLIECEREVRVSVKRKETANRDELVYMDEIPLENYAKALNVLFEDHKLKQIPNTETKPPIIYNPFEKPPVIERTEPIKIRYTRWQRLKILFHKITEIIFKNNRNEGRNKKRNTK
jgi:hypothetical protein